MRTQRSETSWFYEDEVAHLVTKSSRILDIGTGGGERLLRFAALCEVAIGIDPDPRMIATAESNASRDGVGNVRFSVGAAESIPLDDRSVDVVLVRHAPICLPEIRRVLHPGGLFASQQVGENNLRNILEPFGGQYFSREQDIKTVRQSLHDNGFTLDRLEEYETPYRYLDLRSLLFQLSAIREYLGEPTDKGDIDRALKAARASMSSDGTFLSTEHRWLVVAHQPPSL